MDINTAKIAVLLGGDSHEREISLQSGQAVYDALSKQGFDVCKIDIQKKAKETWLKQIQKIDFAFIALHGRGGEDGKIQALLELMDIPYTGSSVTASAIAMNKFLTKQIWQINHLATPKFQLLNVDTDLSEIINYLEFPMMVKPAHEGSSIGISKVTNENELKQAYQLASQFDNVIIAEQYIIGKEYTASLVNGQVLPLIRLETPRDFYDYEAKYKLENTQYHCPCGLEKNTELKIKKIAKKAFKVIAASGWGRVDFMLDAHNQPWLIELNTVPGLTSHSLVPMAARQSGMSFEQLIIAIMSAEI
ncbi:MAG: D-alanine--D-alanine ligase [Pseudomonadota bacterium]